jgi:hypothetical protein
MNIPPYWAREVYNMQAPGGQTISASCWRWSAVSVDDARQQARIAAQQLAGKILNRQHLDRYAYGERPMREEIVQGIASTLNKEAALVTRNAYGALVLNAANAMFIDIDLPQEKPSGGLSKLFGKSRPTEVEKRVDGIEQWARRYPGLGLRVYRTAGGLRCLVTSDVFDPTRESTLEMLQSAASDPLYVTLCRRQECFRARLTPKPWRLGLGRPPARWPWEDVRDETRFRGWEQTYNAKAADYTVCKLVKQIGSSLTHPEVEPIVALHDRMACSSQDLRLA